MEGGHSRREVTNVKDIFVITTVKLGGLNAPMGFPSPLSTPSLIGPIELSNKGNILAFKQL
jgi:hypothetical protein